MTAGSWAEGGAWRAWVDGDRYCMDVVAATEGAARRYFTSLLGEGEAITSITRTPGPQPKPATFRCHIPKCRCQGIPHLALLLSDQAP